MKNKRKCDENKAIDFLKLQRKIRETLSSEVGGDLEKATEIWKKGSAWLTSSVKPSKKSSRHHVAANP